MNSELLRWIPAAPLAPSTPHLHGANSGVSDLQCLAGTHPRYALNPFPCFLPTGGGFLRRPRLPVCEQRSRRDDRRPVSQSEV